MDAFVKPFQFDLVFLLESLRAGLGLQSAWTRLGQENGCQMYSHKQFPVNLTVCTEKSTRYVKAITVAPAFIENSDIAEDSKRSFEVFALCLEIVDPDINLTESRGVLDKLVVGMEQYNAEVSAGLNPEPFVRRTNFNGLVYTMTSKPGQLWAITIARGE